MPNKNYISGVRKERLIVNNARSSGLIAFRSAGSHSPIDVVIINSLIKRIYLIQSKPKSMSDKNKKFIEDKYKYINGSYDVAFIVR